MPDFFILYYEVIAIKTKILVIDDEINIRELLKYNLEKEDFTVLEAEDGLQALAITKEQKPDLVLLDLMLPNIDGLEVCSRLKENSKTAGIPIIMLTAKQDETDMVLGLEMGADDYISKPFSPNNLLARIKAVLRRTQKNTETTNGKIAISNLEIDFEQYEIFLKGEKIYLTPKEFDLLKFFIANTSKIFNRELLLEKVWGYDYYGDTRTIDVHVRHLRAKLSGDEKFVAAIETVRKVGYRFNGV